MNLYYWSNTCCNYDRLIYLIQITRAQERKPMADPTFVYKIMDNYINLPDILSLVKLNVPPRTFRSHPPFHSSRRLTNFAANNCLGRVCKQANSIARQFSVVYCYRFEAPARSVLYALARFENRQKKKKKKHDTAHLKKLKSISERLYRDRLRAANKIQSKMKRKIVARSVTR